MRFSFHKALSVVALSIIVLAPVSAFAATLSLKPSSGEFHKGENFVVSVIASSDTSVNAFFSIISFPTNTLEVISINKSDSIVNLWTQNPSYSNAGDTGNIIFEGVVLNPGFIGSGGKIITITFRVKKEGLADLTFSKYAILENNGLGTNAIANTNGARLTFLPPRINAPENEFSSSARNTVVAVKEVYIPSDNITGIWNFLPEWIQISILSLIGLTVILLSLLIIGLSMVTLIWLWGHFHSRKNEITKRFRSLNTFIKTFIWRIPVFFGMAKKELSGDIEYSIGQLQNDVTEAKDHVPLSRVLVDFLSSIKRIIKRFFTKNDIIEEHKDTSL